MIPQRAAGTQAKTFSGPSATLVQTASRDILIISDRSKRAVQAVGIISYRSDVRSGTVRAELTVIIMSADNLTQDGERELVQDGERELGRVPSTEPSAGHIQQHPHARIFRV